MWNDPKLKVGSMVRAALWLVEEVGEGNTFTKEQLREAFPGVSQIDRRVRDLRDYGWVILTNAEDATLAAEEQRLVRIGVPVWDPAARREAAAKKPISAKEKQEILQRDDYMCVICGISGGEPYPEDSNQTAVLSVSRMEVVLPDGSRETMLATQCKRCRAGQPGEPVRMDEVLADIRALEPQDLRRLHTWITRGRRGSTPLERAWSAYRRLPHEARRAVLEELEKSFDL
ncbi:hypothetical protein [Thermopolyspora flexuosa]|uniref:hypothetical protein n=1 Tax=Thermopolyspora flexuosa TaxID=103836 RepID=UPI001FD10A2A|nr:hypothetical protein [Thermopolyspora flexuosa]